MEYKQLMNSDGSLSDAILRINGSIISTIPNDPNNRDWAEYQEWLSKGNSPQEAD